MTMGICIICGEGVSKNIFYIIKEKKSGSNPNKKPDITINKIIIQAPLPT